MSNLRARGRRGALGIAAATWVLFAGGISADVEFPPILPPGGPRAALDLSAETFCDPDQIRTGRATLEWEVAEQPGSSQQVQVTIFREGFATGRFVSSDPLPPDQTSLPFEQVAGQALHRWRVLTLHEDGLVPSETARFTGPICVHDEADGEEPPEEPQ